MGLYGIIQKFFRPGLHFPPSFAGVLSGIPESFGILDLFSGCPVMNK